ncbi:MAG: hypothetical protein ACMUJI_04825 [Erythrobacter sp.]|uniref:hypothetical protein n=1 Tax=Erythrobacter sp. TaxID=1042 RepID=UPI003A8A9473
MSEVSAIAAPVGVGLGVGEGLGLGDGAFMVGEGAASSPPQAASDALASAKNETGATLNLAIILNSYVYDPVKQSVDCTSTKIAAIGQYRFVAACRLNQATGLAPQIPPR